MKLAFSGSGLAEAEDWFNKHILFMGWMEPGHSDLPSIQEAARGYLRDRCYERHQAPGRTSTLLALSRMQHLLVDGRKALAEKFCLHDIVRLLDVIQGDFLGPCSFEHFITPIADTYGWECLDDVPDDCRPLIATLEGLSPLEKVALADLLERLWHMEMPKGKELGELVQSMGVRLKPAPESQLGKA